MRIVKKDSTDSTVREIMQNPKTGKEHLKPSYPTASLTDKAADTRSLF